jgi:site-specific DNA-methyltransferase (adenine-specific)
MPRLASGLPFGADLPTVRQEKLNADLLAKGDAVPPRDPLSDVMDFPYSQNRLHPTQKPSQAIEPLVRAFRKPDGIVLDPFYGSGSPSSPAVWTAASSASHSTERMS